DGTITTSGAALGSADNISHGSDIVGLLFADSGVSPADIASSETNATTALTFFMSFSNGTNATWNDSLPLSLQMFAKGNLAMYIGYSWDIASIKQLNPSLHFATY